MKNLFFLLVIGAVMVACKKEAKPERTYTTELQVITDTRCHMLYDIADDIDTAYINNHWQGSSIYTMNERYNSEEINCRVIMNDSVGSIHIRVLTDGVLVAERLWSEGDLVGFNQSIHLRYTQVYAEE
jgi:hypothetical protein